MDRKLDSDRMQLFDNDPFSPMGDAPSDMMEGRSERCRWSGGPMIDEGVTVEGAPVDGTGIVSVVPGLEDGEVGPWL